MRGIIEMTEVMKKPTSNIVGNLALTKAESFYMSEVEKALGTHGANMDEEQKACVVSVLTKMQQVCMEKGMDIKSLNQSGLLTILQQDAMLRLNASANPRECYIIIRNDSKLGPHFEFGIEGDGNDKLVRKYGVNVRTVYPLWRVREGDDFTYASFRGLDMEPPTWTPKGCSGKIVRVVYPIKYVEEDGNEYVQYHICEREEVAINLKAHILNNIKMKSADKMSYADKERIKKKIADMDLEQMFADDELLAIMSPAWRDPHSRESMILRKMRNNCLKPIPKDFKDAFAEKAYDDAINEGEKPNETVSPEDIVEVEIKENANSEKLNALPEEAAEEKSAKVEQVSEMSSSDPF